MTGGLINLLTTVHVLFCMWTVNIDRRSFYFWGWVGGFCQQIVRTQPWDLWGVFSDTYPDPPEVHRLSDQLVVLRYLFLRGKLHKAFADLSTQPAKAQRDFTKRLLVITALVQSLFFFFLNDEWQFAQSYFNPVYWWHLLRLRFHSILITDKQFRCKWLLFQAH